jgi:hypothetical protein
VELEQQMKMYVPDSDKEGSKFRNRPIRPEDRSKNFISGNHPYDYKKTGERFTLKDGYERTQGSTPHEVKVCEELSTENIASYIDYECSKNGYSNLAHLHRVASQKEYQHAGHASGLMYDMFVDCQKRNVCVITVEVVAMFVVWFERHGFTKRHFYVDTHWGSAWHMRMILPRQLGNVVNR